MKQIHKLLTLAGILIIVSGSAFSQNKPVSKTRKVKTQTSKTALPSARTIIQKYVAAIGGRAAYQKQTSRVMKGTLEITSAGLKGAFESYAKAPNKSLTRTTLAGIGEISVAFDGQNGWITNPIQGTREQKGEELLQTKLSSDFYREVQLERLFPKLEVKGREKIGEKEVFIVVATPNDSEPETFYFDVRTGLLLRRDTITVSPEGRIPSQTYFEDYREIDGIKLPFINRAVTGGFDAVIKFTEIKHNVPIEDAKFAKPAK
jgi:outer membrane lipoprotein-sorting protein